MVIPRIDTVLDHKQPDRLPQCNFFSDDFIRENGGTEINLYAELGYDMIPLFSNLASDALNSGTEPDEHGIFTDGWGRQCRRTAASGFIEVLKYAPFAIESLTKFRWDDPAMPERFESKLPDNLHHPKPFSAELESRAGSAFICANVYDPFETLARVIGLKNALMALKTDPDKLKPALERFGLYMKELGLAQVQHQMGKINGIWIWGDVAYTRGLMMSPELYREIILPPLKDMCSVFKEHNVRVIYHTDGNPGEIINDLKYAGIDALHPVEQVPGMEIEALLDEYGSKLTFIGGIPPLPRGMELPTNDLEKVLSKMIDLGENGGLIPGFSNFIPSGFDIDILRFMTKYFKEHGYTK